MAEGAQQGERVFTCPAHFCHACSVSGDAQRMVRCCRCPTAYHIRCVGLLQFIPFRFRAFRVEGSARGALLPLSHRLCVVSFSLSPVGFRDFRVAVSEDAAQRMLRCCPPTTTHGALCCLL